MLAYIEGNIQEKQEKTLIIVTHGIGYLVNVTETIFLENEKRDEIALYLHTHVREDDISLFGFPTLSDLNFFKQLISVSGIGPKIGLEILNTDSNLIKNAILSGDLAILTRIPGIGKKTAERMILELKNKVRPDEITSRETQRLSKEIDEEAIDALQSLGYSRGHVYKVLSKTEKLETTEEYIKYFLQNV
ncbi:MAG: Holliday junction branch migration protein RuvA [Patescibacteria group bacterium]|nr:Holliday junction branch migration protein RuvA [Patescibacteria group bacterium]